MPGIPKFSQGEFYSYDDQDVKIKHNFCDCMKHNPFSSDFKNCPPGLNQDLFNKKMQPAKRSVNE